MKKLLLSCILLISSVSVFAQTTCANATNITSNGTKTCPAITGTYSNPCLGGTTNDAGAAMKAIWFKYTPASNGEITISSDLPVNDGATNSDTRLSVLVVFVQLNVLIIMMMLMMQLSFFIDCSRSSWNNLLYPMG